MAQRLIALLDPAERRVTQTILGYPEESVGRLMTPDYVRVEPEWTIAQAMDHIRRYGRDAETVNVIYVVDETGRLIDDLRIRQFLLADPLQTVESIMDRKFIALNADRRPRRSGARSCTTTTASHCRWSIRAASWSASSPPTTSPTSPRRRSTEDIQKMGGMEALDVPYLETGFAPLLRKRGGWLVGPVRRRDAHRDGHGLLRGARSRAPSCWRCSSR